MSDVLFGELSRQPTLTQQVTRHIEEMILDSRLRPGSRLPAERELAQQFGVSKTVVRESLTALTARGLLEPDSRGGSVVRTPPAEAVTQSMALFLRGAAGAPDYAQVHEVRRTLETAVAGHAAERRTDGDITRMEAILDEMDALGRAEDPRYIEADVEFHRAIAQATHNPLFPLLLDSVADIMREVRRYGVLVSGSFENGARHHHAILNRIKDGDAAGAREAMLAHLVDSEEMMRKGQQMTESD